MGATAGEMAGEVVLLVVMAAALALTVVAARSGPAGFFFGVRGADTALGGSPEGRRIVRGYRLLNLLVGGAGLVAIGLASVLAAAGAATQGLRTALMAGGAGVQAAALVISYVAAHRQTLAAVRRTPAGATAEEGERHWILGQIYFNPDDPAVEVPKRFGVGITLNFARPTSWLVIGIPLGIGLLIVLVVTIVT